MSAAADDCMAASWPINVAKLPIVVAPTYTNEREGKRK